MRTHITTGHDRRFSWLNGDGFQIWFHSFKVLGATSDSSACSDTSDKNINFTVGLLPDFWTSGFSMNLRIVRVWKLLKHDGSSLLTNLCCQCDGSWHSLTSWCYYKLSSICSNHDSSFHTHALWHHNDHLVSFGCSYHSQSDTCVSRCWLYKGVPRLDLSFILSLNNHTHCDSVFDWAARLMTL